MTYEGLILTNNEEEEIKGWLLERLKREAWEKYFDKQFVFTTFVSDTMKTVICSR
jgi:hypothetical protein